MLKKVEYAEFYLVFVVAGIGFLCDITGGLNAIIIIFSKNYRAIVPILLSGAVLCAVLNMFLIPGFGLLGAALAYSLTMFILNFTYWAYLKFKFNLQPFNFNFVKVILLSFLVLLVGVYIPYLDNFFLDVAIRSGLMTVLYVSGIFWLNISNDINEAILQVLNKIKS